MGWGMQIGDNGVGGYQNANKNPLHEQTEEIWIFYAISKLVIKKNFTHQH